MITYPYFFGKKDFFHIKRSNKAENFESSVNGLYMRGIKATNLEYKESLVQVELKIDLSKL